MNVSATGDAEHLAMLPAKYRNLNADIEIFSRNVCAAGIRRRETGIGSAIPAEYRNNTLQYFDLLTPDCTVLYAC